VPQPLRLMSWNVRSLRDDRDAVVRVLRRAAPDILFVQEAPRFFRAQSKLAALARESGLVVAAGGRPAAGVAILTRLRVEVDAAESHLLPRTPGLHQRGVALIEAAVGARRFMAASVHLGLRPEERATHADEIVALTEIRPLPVVIAGDINEQAEGAAWRRLAEGRDDVGAVHGLDTFSASRPRRRIDAIFVPSEWSTRPVSPPEIADDSDLAAATDHLPVIVDVMG
jgi:endonuclease/exonuclease/phosphatase family metal-dependent hydrolase